MNRTPPEVPPALLWSIELERALLACLLIDPKSAGLVMDSLSPSSFYDRQNQLVFAAIRACWQRGEGIDILTVPVELAKQGHDLELYVVGLSNEIATGAHLETYAKKVLDLALRRNIVMTCKRAGNPEAALETETGEEYLNIVIDGLMAARGSPATQFVDADKLVPEVLADILHRADERKADRDPDLKTGIPILDRWLGGLKPCKLYIVGSAPSVGKSDLMIGWALNISKRNPVAIISAEMDRRALTVRMLACFHGVNSLDLDYCNLDDGMMRQVFEGIPGHQIYIDDTSSPNAVQIRARIATLVAQKGVKVVFIDHLQELSWHTRLGNDNSNWRATVKAIRDIARDYGVAVVLIQQLSRAGQIPGKRPILKDLRETGEEPADVVIMLYREGVETDRDQLELLVRKNRAGRKGTVYLDYDLTTGRQREAQEQRPKAKEEDDDPQNPFRKG